MDPLLVAKAVISGLLVAIVNVIARREPTLGGLIVAFPVVTLLSAFWLVVDRVPDATVTTFLEGVAWGLVPTFLFVLAMVLALRAGAPLAAAVGIGALAWLALTVVIQRGGWIGA